MKSFVCEICQQYEFDLIFVRPRHSSICTLVSGLFHYYCARATAQSPTHHSKRRKLSWMPCSNLVFVFIVVEEEPAAFLLSGSLSTLYYN